MAGLSFFWMSMLIEIEGNEVGRRAKSTEPQHSATGSAARSWLRMVGGSSLPDRRREPSPDADLQKLSRQGAGGSLWQFIPPRSEEHTSELQSLMRISYAVFCLKKKKDKPTNKHISTPSIPPTTENE